jgi:sugar lactone lactonase YvrE
MKRLLLLMAVCVGVSLAYLKAYEVTPTQATWSGKVDGDPEYGGVGNTFTANFDSLAEVQFFAGDVGGGGQYRATVTEWPGGTLITQSALASARSSHTWVKFDTWTIYGKFVRGKEYLLKVTRPGDSVNYYWGEDPNGPQSNGPYKYGQMTVGGTIQPNYDLCLRLYGKARVGDEFAVQSNVAWSTSVLGHETIPYCSPAAWDSCIRREAEVGAKYDKIGYGFWGYVQRSSPSQFVWGWLDTLMTSYANHGVRPIMSFRGTPGWATCAFESVYVDTGHNHWAWIGRPGGGAIPRGLYEEVRSGDSIINPDNYFAKYIYEFVRRYGPKGTAFNGSQSGTFWYQNSGLTYQPVLLFEGFPEVPYGGLDRCWIPDSAGGYWRFDAKLHHHGASGWNHRESLDDPVYRETLASHIPANGGYRDTVVGRQISLASVYARLMIVVDSAVKMACTSPQVDTIRPKSLAYISDDGFYGMAGWLWWLKHYGADEFFDVATCWGYDYVGSPESHAQTLRWLRSTLADAGYAPRPCVFTEFGTGAPAYWTKVARAYDLSKAYAVVQAANATPGYPALHGAWFTFCEQFMPGDHWSIIRDSAHHWESWEPAYAYKQWSALANKADFEGQVLGSDSTYLLQFEDSLKRKFWMAWAADRTRQDLVVSIPARSDTIDSMSTQLEENPHQGSQTCATDGWLDVTLDTVPLIVTERAAISRPELVVDSISVPEHPQVGSVMDMHAFVHNSGDTTSGAVRLDLVCNDSVFTFGMSPGRIDSGASCEYSFEVNPIPAWMHGWCLFSARVNPGQIYVEKSGLDDNAGYARRYVSRYPTGTVDVVVPPGGKTDAALLPIRLTSHSWETDSITGQTPADSARIIFSWYGQRDSVVHAADTTAWFPFCADTALQFPRGYGKFKVYVQFRDSGANYSPAYLDSADSVVVFDTVSASGSVVINSGTRFAPSADCTLRLAAYDSASGVGWMRFMNRPQVNLVKNGAFAESDGSWSFTNGGYDSSRMALFSVSPSAESKVRQFVPVESISAHYGDSCVLEASILAHMHGGSASGEVSFWYWRTKTNPLLHDTVWLSLGSASYSGDVISLTGRHNLSARFQLVPPTQYSGWVWRGGMVQVRAQGLVTGTGSVWTDNVALNLFQAQTGCAWLGAYDTLAAWNMGSAAGEHVIRGLYLDSAGTENATALADTIILDPTPPVVHISLPQYGQFVSDTVQITGWGYDPIEVAGDTWFASRRLSYRHQDSTNWLPVQPDSFSSVPAYPNWNSLFSPGVHLGYWSTDSLPDGNYYVQLTAADSVGHALSYVTWVVVQNDTSGDDFRAGPPGGGSGMGEGSLYLGSASGNVLHLSDDLDSLGCFSVTDSGSQAYVTAILEVGEDSILVLDARNRRIHKLHKGGQNRRRLVSNLSIPCGITRDANGNFWLVDKGIHRIGKFRSNGTLVFTRGGQGRDSTNLNSPEAIAVRDSLVYVADAGHNRIAVWDTAGNYQGSITGDFENPTAVMVTDSGAIYITDGSDGTLKGITPRGGSFLTISEANGSQLKGLVLSENKHSLFTLATQPNVVHKYRIQSDDTLRGGQQSQGSQSLPKLLSLAQPFPNPARTRLNVSYALPRKTRVTLKLYDITGKLVTTLANNDQKPGYYNLVWNRQDTRGCRVSAGVYFCTLAAEGQRFSRKVVLTE